MLVPRTVGLFVLTAVAEILGCYLPLSLAAAQSVGLAPVSCGAEPDGVGMAAVTASIRAGRVYAAYGGVYVTVALLWLWLVDGVSPDRWDLIGATVTLAGMALIAFAPRG